MKHGVSARQPARDVPAATAPAEHPGSPRSGVASATLLMAGVVLGWLAILVLVLRLAALPPAASGKLLVLFMPGSSEPEAFAAILAAGGAPVRPVLGGLAWIAAADAPGFVARLQANGALAAYPGAPVGLTLAGCFAFATDQPHPLARTLDPRLAGGVAVIGARPVPIRMSAFAPIHPGRILSREAGGARSAAEVARDA